MTDLPRRRTAALAALLLSLLLAACGDDSASDAAQAAPPPPAVVVAPAVREDVAGSISFVGRTEAFREVDLRARVQGFLEEHSFAEGELVEAEQVLFSIDPREFVAAVQAAEAEVERARATYSAAVNELERARTLVARGNISESEVDQRAAEAGRAEADIKAAEAALERARLDLGYTTISAPFEGRIGRSAYDEGNLIGPDSGVLATLVAQDPIYVMFPVSEADYLRYQSLEERPEFIPRITLADGTTYHQEGELAFLDNRVDPLTGTIELRVTFPNPDGLLLPGQFVDVTLTAAEAEPEIVVPQAAVQENQAGRFVLVVGDDNRAEQRAITTGDRVGPLWVVESGLEAGEMVITEGLQKVRPGGQVTPSAGGGPGAGGGPPGEAPAGETAAQAG